MPRILVTGGTGIIGREALLQLAAPGSPFRVLALLRGRDEAEARDRLRQGMSRYAEPFAVERALARIQVLVGDLTRPETLEHPALDRVEQVLHLAGETRFSAYRRADAVNLHGTLALAERARRMPQLRRFLMVGTAMICGEAGAGRLVAEDEFPARPTRHIAHYGASKAAAEQALAERFADLPVVVARPSIVVGHRRRGLEPSSFIFWAFRVCDRLQAIACPMSGGIDVVPIDWVAGALLHLLRAPDLAHRVYHLSAGIAARSWWRDIAQAFDREETRSRRSWYDHIPISDRRAWEARYFQVFDRDDPVDRAMHLGFRVYQRFAGLDVTFSADRLRESGFTERPPSFAEQLPLLMRRPGGQSIQDQFLADNDFGHRQAAAAAG